MQLGLANASTFKVGSGYASILGAYSSVSGLLGRAEVGAKVHKNVSLFGFGEYAQKTGPVVGAGVKVIW